jgi:hypothetical protein
LRKFKSRKIRPSFKPWLQEQFGVDLASTYRIATVLDHMIVNGLAPGGDLALKVNEVLGRLPGAGDDELASPRNGD